MLEKMYCVGVSILMVATLKCMFDVVIYNDSTVGVLVVGAIGLMIAVVSKIVLCSREAKKR